MTMRSQVSISLMSACVMVNAEHVVPVQDSQWRAALVEALMPFTNSDVQAQLGLDHARIAMMTVDMQGGLASLPAAKQQSFVQAWAADMLHVDAHEQVIRWRALADARKVLVSCVHRQIVEDLELACNEAGVRLFSCRPAVLSTMDSVKALEFGEVTVVWTEGAPAAARNGAVQLLGFHDERLYRCWRGWAPADEDIEAIVSRFNAADEAQGRAARVNIHWPSAAGGQA